jgi:hypothetical protein
MDWLSMPKEEQGWFPTNLESTATFLQALRVYLYYKYGVANPIARSCPRRKMVYGFCDASRLKPSLEALPVA